MFWLECISLIAKGDLKWRDALLVAHRVSSNDFTEGKLPRIRMRESVLNTGWIS